MFPQSASSLSTHKPRAMEAWKGNQGAVLVVYLLFVVWRRTLPGVRCMETLLPNVRCIETYIAFSSLYGDER